MSGSLQGRVIPNVEGACVMKERLKGFGGCMGAWYVRQIPDCKYLNVVSKIIGAKGIHRSPRGCMSRIGTYRACILS